MALPQRVQRPDHHSMSRCSLNSSKDSLLVLPRHNNNNSLDGVYHREKYQRDSTEFIEKPTIRLPLSTFSIYYLFTNVSSLHGKKTSQIFDDQFLPQWWSLHWLEVVCIAAVRFHGDGRLRQRRSPATFTVIIFSRMRSHWRRPKHRVKAGDRACSTTVGYAGDLLQTSASDCLFRKHLKTFLLHTNYNWELLINECATRPQFYRTALNAGWSSRKKSVCLSVCPSNAWILTNQKKNLSRFYTIWKIIYPSFVRKRMVGGGDHFYLKYWVNCPPLQRRWFWTDIRS